MSGAGFDAATAVAPAGEGVWGALIDPGWNVGRNPNGGYLLAIGARAMVGAARRPHPLSITAHYLSPPDPGPATVHTEVVKAGRRFVTVAGRLVQDGRERVRLLGVFGDLGAQRGLTRIAAQPPRIPPPDECVPLLEISRAAGRHVPEVMKRFDLRLPPDSPWGRAPETDPYQITGWIRLAPGDPGEGELPLVTFADGFPPTLIGSIDAGWIPTLELTVHVRAVPAPGWLLGSFTTRFLIDGMLEEDGELWDASGRPVALSRQLALLLQ